MTRKIVGTIDQRIIKSGAGLLDVMYSVSKLSKKLGLDPRYIRRALVQKRGAPHIKDEKGHIMINGKELFLWACKYIEEEKTEKNSRSPMMDDEFYCVKCRKRVIGKSIHYAEENQNRFLKAICPNCGTKINKYLKGNTHGKKNETSSK